MQVILSSMAVSSGSGLYYREWDSKRNKKLNIYNYERSKRNYYKRGNKVSVI